MRRALPYAAMPLLLACESTRPSCEEGTAFDWDQQACVPYQAGDPLVPDEPVWTPAPGTTWQWQLSGDIDTSLDVAMYDVDLFEATDADLAALSDRVVICYFSAGSYEEFRPDAQGLPDEAIGQRLEGWRDERWLDVTHPAVRALTLDRLDLAVERGCDGVEPDNVDGASNVTGFHLTSAEQLAYNRFIADEAHRRGLSVGLKNDLARLADLEPWFDWALNEGCYAFEECGAYTPFHVAEKAIFHAEYVDDWAQAQMLADRVCGMEGFSTLIKTWDLGPEYLACE